MVAWFNLSIARWNDLFLSSHIYPSNGDFNKQILHSTARNCVFCCARLWRRMREIISFARAQLYALNMFHYKFSNKMSFRPAEHPEKTFRQRTHTHSHVPLYSTYGTDTQNTIFARNEFRQCDRYERDAVWCRTTYLMRHRDREERENGTKEWNCHPLFSVFTQRASHCRWWRIINHTVLDLLWLRTPSYGALNVNMFSHGIVNGVTEWIRMNMNGICRWWRRPEKRKRKEKNEMYIHRRHRRDNGTRTNCMWTGTLKWKNIVSAQHHSNTIVFSRFYSSSSFRFTFWWMCRKCFSKYISPHNSCTHTHARTLLRCSMIIWLSCA